MPRTLVFDEIDTGIGGGVAEAVGRKLKKLSGSNQVLCVTHWRKWPGSPIIIILWKSAK